MTRQTGRRQHIKQQRARRRRGEPVQEARSGGPPPGPHQVGRQCAALLWQVRTLQARRQPGRQAGRPASLGARCSVRSKHRRSAAAYAAHFSKHTHLVQEVAEASVSVLRVPDTGLHHSPVCLAERGTDTPLPCAARPTLQPTQPCCSRTSASWAWTCPAGATSRTATTPPTARKSRPPPSTSRACPTSSTRRCAAVLGARLRGRGLQAARLQKGQLLSRKHRVLQRLQEACNTSPQRGATASCRQSKLRSLTRCTSNL